jgi:hypothetical protein
MSSLYPECGAIPVAASTRVPCLCATSLDDMGALLASYSGGDFSGVIDLLARGKAISLAEGVELQIVSRGDRTACVRVESGTHIGEHCWISVGLIGDRIAH